MVMLMATDVLETIVDKDVNLQFNRVDLHGCMEAKEKLSLLLGNFS
jgi:hypothetical protein